MNRYNAAQLMAFLNNFHYPTPYNLFLGGGEINIDAIKPQQGMGISPTDMSVTGGIKGADTPVKPLDSSLNSNNGGESKSSNFNLQAAIGGASSLISDAIAQTNEVAQKAKAIKNGIGTNESIMDNNIGASNTDDLYNQLNNITSFNAIQKSDLLNSKGNYVGRALMNTASGAGAGMSAGGPWGALAGATAGTLSSIFGSLAANRKAKRETKKINNVINENNLKQDLVTSNAINNQRMNASLFGNIAANGGQLNTVFNDFNNGVITYNTGGTHEENPNEGIQVGVDPQGTPNLVEEGEVNYKDFIFSNRIEVPNDLKKQYKLKGETFADVAKYANKESEERPLDPISKRGLDAIMQVLQQSQEQEKQKKDLQNAALQQIVAQSLQGSPQSVSPEEMQSLQSLQGNQKQYKYGGKVNLFAENGQMIPSFYPTNLLSEEDYYKDFDKNFDYDSFFNQYQNRFKPSNLAGNIPYDYNLTSNYGQEGITNNQYNAFTNALRKYPKAFNKYQQALSKYSGRSESAIPAILATGLYREDNKFGNFSLTPTTFKSYNDYLDSFNSQPKEQPSQNNSNLSTESLTSSEEKIPQKFEDDSSIFDQIQGQPTWQRYAGLLPLMAGVFSRPEYNEANELERRAAITETYNPIRGSYIGDYQQYNPYDINYIANQLRQQGNTSLSQINNMSGYNRGAALASAVMANYNTQQALGNAYLQAMKANDEQRFRVGEFNRGTNQYNSQVANQTSQFNAQQRAAALQRSDALRQAAASLRYQERLAADTARGQALTNIGNSLQNIGKENFAFNQNLFNVLAGTYGTVNPKLYPLLLKLSGIQPKSKQGKNILKALNKKNK